MFQRSVIQKTALVSVVAMSVLISACSSSDDDASVVEQPTDGTTAGTAPGGNADEGTADGGSELNPNLQTISVLLDSTSTVPPANVDGASGEGSFSVDTETGAIAGSVTVMGVTGTPTIAHIHTGAAGVAGPTIITLVPNDDSTVWTTPEDAALDAVAIELFNEGSLYVNVHTEANPAGELRSQLVDANVPAAGSVTITFRNTSETQPMTPPVVALHNAPDAAENGIRLFAVGAIASPEVVMIAEDGAFDALAAVAEGQIAAGAVSAAGVARPAEPGPLLPGASASIDLQIEAPDQVLSVVSMVVCTNDGFSGIDSRPLSADATETFFAPIYDAGSETNIEMLSYWVPPCSGPAPAVPSMNIGDEEGLSITLHPGQTAAENPDFNFPAGSELLEITVTRN